jgi:hypothetical protein
MVQLKNSVNVTSSVLAELMLPEASTSGASRFPQQSLNSHRVMASGNSAKHTRKNLLHTLSRDGSKRIVGKKGSRIF